MRFVCLDVLLPGKEISLDREQSRHLTKVLRLGTGAVVEIVDGKGTVAHARVTLAHADRARVCIDQVTQVAAPSKIHIAFGISKGQALDFLVRRCTEVGVASFQPLVTQHSLRESGWNQDRWARVIAEVCKQCQSSVFPVIFSPLSLAEWLKQSAGERLRFVCDENDREQILENIAPSEGYAILTGPEGGWSALERQQFSAAGLLPLSLGTLRLRAEMAALVACVVLKTRIGEI